MLAQGQGTLVHTKKSKVKRKKVTSLLSINKASGQIIEKQSEFGIPIQCYVVKNTLLQTAFSEILPTVSRLFLMTITICFSKFNFCKDFVLQLK